MSKSKHDVICAGGEGKGLIRNEIAINGLIELPKDSHDPGADIVVSIVDVTEIYIDSISGR